VFALDHHDGSCPYTEDRSGEKFWSFDTDAAPLSEDINKAYEDFHGRVITRETEIRCLIDDLYHPAFCRKALKFTLEPILDFDKLVVAGHSFGGAATLKVG
jgi:predicted dienelactone hydrolase